MYIFKATLFFIIFCLFTSGVIFTALILLDTVIFKENYTAGIFWLLIFNNFIHLAKSIKSGSKQ